jgi:hypothetical protein
MSDQKIILSQKTCDTTFKNVLRGNPDTVKFTLIFHYILPKKKIFDVNKNNFL